MTRQANPRQLTSRSEREAHARKLRAEGLLLREIGAEMGISTKTVHNWLCDPGGVRLRARKDSYRGTCEVCGAQTDGSDGRDAAPSVCIVCLTWTPEAILEAIRDWAHAHGGNPPKQMASIHADGKLPCEQTVRKRFGTWSAAIRAAGFEPYNDRRRETTEAMAQALSEGMTLEQVGERFGCTPSNVWQRINRIGLSVTELRRAA
jgi:DNA-binding CsgD family transcriptional regulator